MILVVSPHRPSLSRCNDEGEFFLGENLFLKFLIIFTFLIPVPISSLQAAPQFREPSSTILLAKRKRKKRRSKRGYKKDSDFEWSLNQKNPPASLETNVFGVVSGVVNAEYYMPFGERTLIGGAGYLYGIGSDVSGFGFGGLYSLYINKLYDGLFVTGGATFTSLSVNDTSASGFSVLGIGGYKYNLSKTFSVSGGAGIQYFTFGGSLDGFNAIGFSLIVNLGMYLD